MQELNVTLAILILEGPIHNGRLLIKYVKSEENILADALSRQKFQMFWKKSSYPGDPSPLIWLPQKFWIDYIFIISLNFQRIGFYIVFIIVKITNITWRAIAGTHFTWVPS